MCFSGQLAGQLAVLFLPKKLLLCGFTLLYLLYFICPLVPSYGMHVCLSTVLTLLYLSSWTILCVSFYCTYFTLSVHLDHPMACMCVFLLYLLYFMCPLGPSYGMHVCLSTVLTLLYLSSWTILWHACLSFYCTYFTLSVLLDHPMACMSVFLLYLLYFICPLGPSYGMHVCLSTVLTLLYLSSWTILWHACLSFYCTYFTLSVLLDHPMCVFLLYLLYFICPLGPSYGMHVCLSTVLTLLYPSSWTILCVSFYCTYFTLSVLLDHPMACMSVFLLYLLYFICPLVPSWPCMCVFLLYLLYFICPLGPSWVCMCVFLLYLLYFICPLGPSYGMHVCLSVKIT